MIKYFILFLSLIFSAEGFSQLPSAYIVKKKDSINIVKAKQYFKEHKYNEVISICKNEKKSSYTFNLIAKSYKKLGDYNKSINYYEKLIQLNQKNNDLKSLFKSYVDIAKVHKNLNNTENYKKSVHYINKAISLSHEINVSELELHSVYNNLGNYYSRLKNKPLAIKNHAKAYKIATKISNNRKIELSLCNIGNLYFEGIDTSPKDLKIASKHYNASLQFGKQFSYYNYLNLGIISYLQDSPKEALTYYNKALNSIESIDFKTPDEFPTIKSIQKSSSKDKIVGILFEKYYAFIKLFKETKNKIHQKNALKTIELADFTLDLIFIELENKKSQLFWKKKASSFYLLGAHISHLLQSPEKAFYFTEKNKALLLLNSLQKNKHTSKLNLPKKITKRSTKLKKDIYYLNYLSSKLKNDSIKNALFDKQRSLERFQDSIERFYPEYDYIKTVNSLSNIKDAKNVLTNNNSMIISYIWDKTENQYDGLYGVAITKDTSLVFKIEHLKSFNINLRTYKELILKPYNTVNDLSDLKKISHKLFNNLFPNKAVKKLIKNHTKLLILPDNDLQNIPFETLIIEPNTNNYLINTHEISYAYSISFLKENKKLIRQAKNTFLGFAPSRFKYENLEELPRTKSEIETIKKIINGDNFNNEDATKENFFKELNNYKIIHLATHANANDSISPWIAFKNKKLYLNELYTAKNQAELVVLSACNTSLGKINPGEGVFSLARGFFYSGANSVISSLWNVNDKSTQEITSSFYKYLKKGNTKSQALRQAKLNYLNTHSLSEASPYYWSSLILIGDDAAISFQNKTFYYVLFSILLVFIIVLFFFLRRRRRS